LVEVCDVEIFTTAGITSRANFENDSGAVSPFKGRKHKQTAKAIEILLNSFVMILLPNTTVVDDMGTIYGNNVANM
jgi:hypothetical protein